MKFKPCRKAILGLSVLLAACGAPSYTDYQPTPQVQNRALPTVGTIDTDKNRIEAQELSEISSNSYNQIALLMPISSKYSRAARAFEDGFREAYRDSTAAIRPVLQTYDIGEEQQNLFQIYNQAISEGADFIIGPLGNEAVEALAQKADFRRPTLAIAQLPEDEVEPNLFGFSLSPEAEARQVAEYAYANGLRRARIFRPDNDWGKRVARAFEQTWLQLGGTIDRNLFYPRGIEDYSSSIRNLLGLRDSDNRHRTVRSVTGLDLRFDANSGNTDFLFLVANTQVARIMVPQIRFHNGHDLTIYSISTIFSGAVNPVLDLDLENVIFSDLHWIIESARRSQANQYVARSQYQGTALDRIYDLGYESYELLFKVKSLRNRNTTITGETMDIRIDDKGNIEPVFAFAQFKDGIAQTHPSRRQDSVGE